MMRLRSLPRRLLHRLPQLSGQGSGQLSGLRSLDVYGATAAELAGAFEELWTREPALRPRPEMHDYQLTYPPAVQIQIPAHARAPSDQAFVDHAVGDFKAAGYYFHFGFCEYRCRYCFHYELTTKRRDERMARYVDAMTREMARFRQLAPALKTGLYFLGGGTPTALPTALLDRFLTALLGCFGPPPTQLSTVEAKPITATEEKLALLVQAGFRRINLGVQTLDPELYGFHHQGEDLQIAYEAIERARRLGFEYVNIDLMTGLERQTPASWDKTLTALERLAASGAIDSVFLYPFHDDPRSRTYEKRTVVPSFHETAHSDATMRALMERLGWKDSGPASTARRATCAARSWSWPGRASTRPTARCCITASATRASRSAIAPPTSITAIWRCTATRSRPGAWASATGPSSMTASAPPGTSRSICCTARSRACGRGPRSTAAPPWPVTRSSWRAGWSWGSVRNRACSGRSR